VLKAAQLAGVITADEVNEIMRKRSEAARAAAAVGR